MMAQGQLAAATTACEEMEAKIKREKEFGEKIPIFHCESPVSNRPSPIFYTLLKEPCIPSKQPHILPKSLCYIGRVLSLIG